mmetsp:Transcript_11422/g.24261  ORF Transcript_11422/g.24261 Transcript_11422/m.24261 type:complete len:327 (+) Transcript_11422:178-1158(+)
MQQNFEIDNVQPNLIVTMPQTIKDRSPQKLTTMQPIQRSQQLHPTPPNTPQQKAFAYAPKPFALLSFLSALLVIHYLFLRHPQKLKRMYHRIILSTFFCLLFESLALFWGTWAVPVGTPHVIGAFGNDATCATEGFLLTSFGWAESLYYASLSIYTLMAVKHNFREEKYQWIEKWIHGISIGVPLIFSIVGVAGHFFRAGLAYCHLTFMRTCDPSVNGDLQECRGGRYTLLFHVPYIWIITVSFLTSSSAMIYLYHSFEQTEDDVEQAVGMRLLIQSAKKQKLKEVAQQLGLYLFSCWFGYIVLVIWMIIYFDTGNLNYPLMSTYH